jgi:hypothetical protein
MGKNPKELHVWFQPGQYNAHPHPFGEICYAFSTLKYVTHFTLRGCFGVF